MDPQELNRRDFHRLTAAAFGGVLAGSLSGCGEDKPQTPAAGGAAGGAPAAAPAAKSEVAASDAEPHACRGLNACKNQGAGGKNDCAGQGDCATKSWYHSCSGQNDCKGQGGCGETATTNSCKGQGACHIPLMASAWETARKHFEKTREEAGQKFGVAPPKAKK